MIEWNKEDFGVRLKTLREQRGLSMMAFGTAIGTSASRIKDWEKGKNAPSAAWIAKISERFNVSTDELILGIENGSNPFKSWVTNSEMLYEKLRETITGEVKADMQTDAKGKICMQNLMRRIRNAIGVERGEGWQKGNCLRF